MKVSFLNFEINISRKTKEIEKEDVDYLNKKILDQMLKRGSGFYQDKLESILLPLESDDLIIEASSRIEKDGIFIIPNFLESNLSDKLCRIIDEKISNALLEIGVGESYETDAYIVQREAKLVKGYSALANNSKAVVDIRSGSDEGMVDVFNIDKLIKEENGKSIISDIQNNKILNGILKCLHKDLEIKNINTYVNNGVTSTRGFHADSYSRQIKIFIYLTDVLDFESGPYTFVKGTHVETPYRRINRLLSRFLSAKTEAPVVPFEDIYPVLAPKGSLVISDQAGFHRGFPQSKDGSRRVLTINCR